MNILRIMYKEADYFINGREKTQTCWYFPIISWKYREKKTFLGPTDEIKVKKFELHLQNRNELKQIDIPNTITIKAIEWIKFVLLFPSVCWM